MSTATATKTKVKLEDVPKLIEADTGIQTEKEKQAKGETSQLVKKMEKRLKPGKSIITADGKEVEIEPGMTADEQKELKDLEVTIERGECAFYESGKALITIRDKKLYRENFKTFDLYCAERWGFTRSHASRLTKAYKSVTKLVTLCPESKKIITAEGPAREFTKGELTDAELKKSFIIADKTAKKENTKLTAKIAKKAIEKVTASREEKPESNEKKDPTEKQQKKFCEDIEKKADSIVEKIDGYDYKDSLSKENKKFLVSVLERTYLWVKQEYK